MQATQWLTCKGTIVWFLWSTRMRESLDPSSWPSLAPFHHPHDIAKRQARACSTRRRGETSKNNSLSHCPSKEEHAIAFFIAEAHVSMQVLTAAAEKRAVRSMQRDVRRQEARARRQARSVCPAA